MNNKRRRGINRIMRGKGSLQGEAVREVAGEGKGRERNSNQRRARDN